MTYFTVDKSMSSPSEWCIWFNDCGVKYFLPQQCSFSVVEARIMGLSYPEFLRYMRDVHGARLVGKNKYPRILFPTKESATAAAKVLDNRLSAIIKLYFK